MPLSSASSKAEPTSPTSPTSPKLNPKSSRSRNTLNQRQSRARRKTYVSELEGKLRWYESAGVQATREVQVAAQQVIEDNRRLKWILQQRFGVDERELTLLLSSHGQTFSTYGGSLSRGDLRCPRCGAGYGGMEEEGARNPMLNQPQLPSPPYIDPEPPRTANFSLQQPDDVQRAFVSTHCRPPAASNSMPCEEAAAIIASMRGGDAQDVYPELGCSTNSRCDVNNVQVMSLMDEDDRRR